ncbi:MAG: kelch repeat-containing protein, partial [Myxococcota bacterium]
MQLRLVVCLAVVSCTCRPGQLGQVEEAQLRASPMHLVLPAAYVGYPTSGVVEVANVGGTPASVEVSAAEPFSVETGQLELVTGESRSLVVRFAPTAAGLFDGVLRIGALEVTLAAEGLEVPVCSVPANVCEETRFEAEAGQCVTTLKEEGSSCQTRCIASGSCLAGACRGQLADCDDGNACTVDACGEAEGCVHSSRVCPAPAGRCQIARCDPLTGCGAEEAPDGTLCGPDDCKASEVDVCIAGKCVRRQRPDQGRCVNTWVPVNTPARSRHAMAYDLTRQRVVLFGGGSSGHFGDTWEWDGTTWVQRTPAMSPPARAGHAMAYDTARQRVVLFGGWNGVQSLADTWEWDGTTWVQRAPTTSPPAVSNHVMAYDVARQRVVVFSRDFGAVPIGTWEWDGTTWVQRMPTTSPPALINPALAYDMVRQRVVLFGHEVGGLADTWEWDGTTWVERTPAMSPPVRTNHAMTYDAVRQRVVLFGGYNGFQALSDT